MHAFATDPERVRLGTQTSSIADLRIYDYHPKDPDLDLFRISYDGTKVETDDRPNRVPTLLDTTALKVTRIYAPTPDLFSWQPTDGTLKPVWFLSEQPEVNGNRLTLRPGDRSLAVDVRLGRVLLGSYWSLCLFNADASMAWQRSVPTNGTWRVAQSPDGRLVVAALGDGTVRWYRASDGEELLAIFLHADHTRWAAFTPSGYYATSPDGENLIGWQINKGPDQAADFFPASRFHDRFYRPDVVARVLQTLNEAEAVQQADAARRAQ